MQHYREVTKCHSNDSAVRDKYIRRVGKLMAPITLSVRSMLPLCIIWFEISAPHQERYENHKFVIAWLYETAQEMT